MYFIGNILDSHAKAAQHPEAHKQHFHITPEEASAMNVKGLPVHLEHANNVKVGNVIRSWDERDGTKWVLAHVDTSSIEGKFVRNDLSAQVPVYSSLSLQHIYNEYTDGSSHKVPVEVSICKEPRRPGCKIVHASIPSRRTVYKGDGNNTRMMSSTNSGSSSTGNTNDAADSNVPANSNPGESVSASACANNNAEAASAANGTTPSTTQLMAEVVEASRQNSELQKQLELKTAALADIERQKKEAKELELQKQTQLAEELGNAVLEHVAKLDPALANQDTTKAIGTLREQYPQEVARLLEVACCASKHAAKLEQQLVAQKEESERKLMEQKYHAAVAERPGCHGVQDTATVHASNKRQRTDADSNPYAVNMARPQASSRYGSMETIEQIHAAYQGLRGHGSTTDAMKAVAGIIPQQRSNGFR